MSFAVSLTRADRVATGRSTLTRALSSGDPQKALAEFQVQHDLQSSRCDAILELSRLSKHDGSRAEVYKALALSLVKNLEQAIPSMSRAQQDALLDRSFPFIRDNILRGISVALIKRRPDLPVAILNELALNPQLSDV